jgi:hypothetical protein
MKSKSQKKEKQKNSEEKKIETKNDIIKKNNANLNTKPQNPDKFPKNVNEFRHIMDDVNCCRADIEFMLELRRPKKFLSLDKNSTLGEPQFYQDDLSKYKTKKAKKWEEKKLLQTNMGTFRQIFSNRAKYAINSSVYRYEVGLRTEPNKISSKSLGKKEGEDKKNTLKTIPWNSTTIPRERTLLDKLLPPILQPSKELFSKFENKVGRPVIKIKKDGYINGNKVYGRIFDYNKTLAYRYPSDHFPSSKYINDYGTQNIEAIRHLLDSDNRTMTSYWSTYLRGEKKKKFLKDDIVKREKKLRDKSNEKNYASKQ